MNSASRKFIWGAKLQLCAIEKTLKHFLHILALSSTTTAMIFCLVKSGLRPYIQTCTAVSIHKTKESWILYMTKPSILLSHFWRSWILRLFTVPKGFHPCSPSQFPLIWNLNRIPWLRHSRNRGYLLNWRIYLREI